MVGSEQEYQVIKKYFTNYLILLNVFKKIYNSDKYQLYILEYSQIIKKSIRIDTILNLCKNMFH